MSFIHTFFLKSYKVNHFMTTVKVYLFEKHLCLYTAVSPVVLVTCFIVRFVEFTVQ